MIRIIVVLTSYFIISAAVALTSAVVAGRTDRDSEKIMATAFNKKTK